jgi:hypothetical protein
MRCYYYGTENPRRNLDSLGYQPRLDSPKTFPGRFRTHVDIVSTTEPRMKGFVRLQDSGATARYMAVGGCEMSLTADGSPTRRAVHEGAIVLVSPGPGPGQWTVCVPRNDILSNIASDADVGDTPANPRRKHSLRQELDTPTVGDED